MDEHSTTDTSSEPQQLATTQEPEAKGPLSKRTLSRRRFLVVSGVTGAAGASLLIGFSIATRRGGENAGIRRIATFVPSIWVRIDSNDIITVTVAKSEMGQGVLTALAMALAEDLDADWSRVRVEQAQANGRYGEQLTDGSSSVSGSFAPMRGAGSSARGFLVAAAAHIWGVDHSTCRTEKGAVIHTPSGRRLRYGEVAATAATLTLDAAAFAETRIKPPSQFALIGTRAPRVDTPAKVDGSAIFGLDVRVPGMRYATIARSPTLGGTLARYDDTRARAVPGVLRVVPTTSGVAVVATNTWAAIKGRQALDVTWNPGANVQIDSPALRAQLAAKLDNMTHGGAGSAGPGGKTVAASYEAPFLAHATMEPMNCTAWVRGNTCEVWAPTQNPTETQNVAANASGLLLEAVTVHVTFMGGGFGRRTYTDFVDEAVQVSKAVDAPVQVVWTRDDDMQHDFYRPAALHTLRASLTAQGLPASWTHATVTQSNHGESPTDAADLPYFIASPKITGAVASAPVPTGIWRSFNYSHTIFAIESFVDELAAEGGLDPYQFRLQLLKDPSLHAVVLLAASRAGWGTPLPSGWGRGMALCNFNAETPVAEVAEVSVDPDGTVHVHRVVCAVDCGLVVNPAIAEAQVEGAVVYGLTAALKGEITVANGQIQQRYFHDYPLLRMDEMPLIEVSFVPGGQSPSGLGEPALPPIAPAVANAIFAATGRRIRRLPIRPADLV